MATATSQQQGNGSSAKQSFGARVEHIGSSAQQLWSEAREAATELNRTLDLAGRTQKHPYAMVAAAAGIGYVLAGGLFTGLTARVLRIGLRLAALPMVKAELLGMVENALMGATARSQDAAATPPV